MAYYVRVLISADADMKAASYREGPFEKFELAASHGYNQLLSRAPIVTGYRVEDETGVELREWEVAVVGYAPVNGVFPLIARNAEHAAELARALTPAQLRATVRQVEYDRSFDLRVSSVCNFDLMEELELKRDSG